MELAKQSQHFFELLESLKWFKHWERTAKSLILSALNLKWPKLDYMGLQRISGNQPVIEYLNR